MTDPTVLKQIIERVAIGLNFVIGTMTILNTLGIGILIFTFAIQGAKKPLKVSNYALQEFLVFSFLAGFTACCFIYLLGEIKVVQMQVQTILVTQNNPEKKK